MAKNYLIAIGGTGARVIKALLHLCAAGLGPESLSIFLIDPDQANENLSDSEALLRQYKTTADQWRSRPRNGLPRVFGTDIQFKPVWTVFKNKDVTLAGFVNEPTLRQSNEDFAQLISVLFTEDELRTPLSRGFRGHPSIGAVVMSNVETGGRENLDMTAAEGLKKLWEDIHDGGEGVGRVFVVGSVFGGTGAAGVPTFGSPKMLKHHENASLDANKSRIRLGAALVLPYFSFEVNEEARRKEKGDMYVTPADFPIATKAALEYYSEKELAFDQLYFIGDSLGAEHRVGTFGTGGKEQHNKPHYIELVTALAAFDFWRESAATPETQHFIAGRDDSTVTWSALPVTTDPNRLAELRRDLTARVAAFTAFGYVLNTYGSDFLNAGHKSPLTAVKWYVDHFKFDDKKAQDDVKNPRKGDSKDAILAVASYTRDFIDWIATIGELSNVQLVDGKQLLDDKGAFRPPLAFPGSIGGFLDGIQTVSGKATFNEFVTHLNENVRITDPAISASDKFLNLLYEAAYDFCNSAYGLSAPRATPA